MNDDINDDINNNIEEFILHDSNNNNNINNSNINNSNNNNNIDCNNKKHFISKTIWFYISEKNNLQYELSKLYPASASVSLLIAYSQQNRFIYCNTLH